MKSKSKRPGTKQRKVRLPSDLPDAAEAALDDLMTGALEVDDDEEIVETENRDPFPRPLARPIDTGEMTSARVRDPGREPLNEPPLLDESDDASLEPIDDTRRVGTVPPDDVDVPDHVERVVPELPSLRFAVYEESASLQPVQNAIVACGHVIATVAAGRDGVARVVDAIHGGSIDAVIVALPAGDAIIAAALALEPRRPVIVASLAGDALPAVTRALAAGADLVTTRPHQIERLAPILLATTRVHLERRLALAARGSEQVLRARLDELADPEPRGLLPFEMFQRVLELELKRAKRFEYPISVALFAVEVVPPPPPAGIRGILRARAGNALINTIRDIDMATQLDHERFLVLLPYTDLKGSAGLARRVIAAVAAGDPVVAGGRSFPPRVVGAVAGAPPGQPVSFSKLMKDATRALEQARRDGAELAVQP